MHGAFCSGRGRRLAKVLMFGEMLGQLLHSQAKLDGEAQDVNIARAQRRRPAPSLKQIEREHTGRNQAVLAAHETGAYSYQQIAEHFGIHFTTAGRIVRAGRKNKRKTNNKSAR